MTFPASWTNDLYLGISQFLAAASAVTFLPTQEYRNADRTALLPGVVEPVLWWGRMADGPDRGIAMTLYTSVDDPAVAHVAQSVQFLIRGTTDIRSLNPTGDSLFNALHGLAGVTLNGIFVASVQRKSVVPLPPDALGRWTTSHNYNFYANRPSNTRTA